MTKISHLYTASSSGPQSLEGWRQNALNKFQRKMTDKEKPFPCIPATIGFAKNQLRYGFANDPGDPASIQKTASILKEYTKHSREYGNYTSLIIFYKQKENLSAEDYGLTFLGCADGAV